MNDNQITADLIVNHLLALVILLEHGEELHDVRVLRRETQLGEGAMREQKCGHTSASN